jgi:hypothetical protein
MNGGKTTTGRVLIVEADLAVAALYADLIHTRCPGLRIDCCHPDQRTLVEDNAGGADVVVFSCGHGPATALDFLRELLTMRPCLTTLSLVPADRPELAAEAIAAGATDVLLKAPGYLDQLPVAAHKNVYTSRIRTAERTRIDLAFRAQEQSRRAIAELRKELAAAGVAASARPDFDVDAPMLDESSESPRIEIRTNLAARAA